MLRYSLGSLFLALLYFSIACAALVNANGVWPQVAVTLTLAILVLFSLGAIFWNERRRDFAIGFSATGWLYILLAFSSVTSIRPYLLTESLTNQLYGVMHSSQTPQTALVYQAGASGPIWQTTVSPAQMIPPPTAAGSNRPAPVYRSPAPMFQLRTTTAIPTYSPAATGRPYVEPQSFANIGHSLWAVIVAFVGGMTAQVLAKRRKQADAADQNEGS